jgi:hypothetical protein
MAMGRQGPRQGEMLVTWDELPKSPGPTIACRRCGPTLVSTPSSRRCASHMAILGAPSLPPGR